MSSNFLLIILYLFNLTKNLMDYKYVFNLHKDNYKEHNCAAQTTYIIKFFILSLFHILILYLLSKNAGFEAKPLILISYGLAIPIYTIEYIHKFYLKNSNYFDIIMFILQCSASTLAIFLIWSRQSITSALTLITLTSAIMVLPLIFLRIYNYQCINRDKNNNNVVRNDTVKNDLPSEETHDANKSKCLKQSHEGSELSPGKQSYC